MKVAFLGLGIMGNAMARNLVKAGNQVAVWNRSSKSIEGARTASSPADAAREAEVVWMCVSDTAAVELLLFAADGVASTIKPGTIVVDSSTISPAATRDFAAKLRAKGADYVDAPVTGSKIGAESAQLIFIVGGKAETLARLESLFSAMGKKVVHMGETGLGQSAKLAMNLQIAMIYEGFAEALTLAKRLGVQPEKLIELIQASMVRSGVIDYKAPFVLQHDWAPNFPMRLMEKDLNLVKEAAAQQNLRLPGLESVRGVYEKARAAGKSDLDYAATLDVIETS
ncbi:MAG: NAD(P)-dependent oxidoreductase [Terriglobales bacterium]|jgi:2-hydroxy-3-oxopropionate reductase